MGPWSHNFTWLLVFSWLLSAVWFFTDLPTAQALLVALPSGLWLLSFIGWQWGLNARDPEQVWVTVLAAAPVVVLLIGVDWQAQYGPLVWALLTGLIGPRLWLVRLWRAPVLRPSRKVPVPAELVDGQWLLCSGIKAVDQRLRTQAKDCLGEWDRRQLSQPEWRAFCQALGLQSHQWWPMILQIEGGRLTKIAQPSWLYANIADPKICSN